MGNLDEGIIAIMKLMQERNKQKKAQVVTVAPPVAVQQDPRTQAINSILNTITQTMVDSKIYPAPDAVKLPAYNINSFYQIVSIDDDFNFDIKFNVPSGKVSDDLDSLGRKLASALRYKDVERYYEANDPQGIIRFHLFRQTRPGLDFYATIPYDWETNVDFEHIPFGKDVKEETVNLSLYENHFLIGGMTGAGKSVASAIMLLGAARLKNYVMLGIDLKKVELKPWESRFSGVARTREEAQLMLKALKDEMEDRNDILAEEGLLKLPKDSKTPRILCVVDEVAELFEGANTKEDKELQAEIVNTLISIGQLGRNTGITLLLMTQNPKADIIPTQLRNNLTVRVAYRTADPIQTKVILGEVSSQDGVAADAHLIEREQRGVGYLKAGDGRIKRIKTFYITDEERIEAIQKMSNLKVKVSWLKKFEETRLRTDLSRFVERELITPDILNSIINFKNVPDFVSTLTNFDKRTFAEALESNVILQRIVREKIGGYTVMDELVEALEAK